MSSHHILNVNSQLWFVQNVTNTIAEYADARARAETRKRTPSRRISMKRREWTMRALHRSLNRSSLMPIRKQKATKWKPKGWYYQPTHVET